MLAKNRQQVPIFLLLLAGAQLAAAKPVEVTITGLMPSSHAHDVRLRLEPVYATSTVSETTALVHTLHPPGSVSFDLQIGSSWLLKVESSEYWSPEQLVTIESETETIRANLVRKGVLRARLETEAGVSLGRVGVRFQSSPSAKRNISQTLLPCSHDGKALQCEVPAGLLDVRIRAEGFISHYLWDVRIPGGGVHDLGSLKLRRGASVVGWVEPPHSTFDFSACTVELAPQEAGDILDVVDAARRDTRIDRTSVNQRGFFEFLDVQPGSYVVTVRHPDFAPTRYFPTHVLSAAETEILELTPSPPAAVTLRVVPELDPYQKPWSVTLAMEGSSPGVLATVATGHVASNGEWRHRGLEPGRYRITVEDHRGDPWLWEMRMLTGDELVELRLEAQAVEGKILLDEEPIVASVSFGGRRRVPSLNTTSSSDGTFRLVVPLQENWIVDVGVPALGINRRLVGVRIEPTAEEGVGRVEFVIPDTLLEGEVVDEAGNPSTDAEVSIMGSETGSSTSSSPPAGKFRFRGLPPGEYRLQARSLDDEWLSDRLTARIEEGTSSPVRLVLRRQTTVAGQLIAPEGHPVINAHVIGLLEQPGFTLSSIVPEAVTDVNGVFSFRVPAETRGLQLTFFASSYATRQLRIELPHDGPLIVTLDRIGGTLTIAMEEESASFALVTVFKDYLVGNPSVLHTWAQLNGIYDPRSSIRVFPMLEPGRYHACYDAGFEVLMTGRLPADASAKCIAGELPPFGDLELRLPVWE